MAALRLAVRRLCDLVLRRSAGIYEQKAAKALPNIDHEHLKAVSQFPKLLVKDDDDLALQIFKSLQESPVEGHKDVTLREVRVTIKTLAELRGLE